MDQHDVIILGAGAAGLFCAGQAGQRGLRVALLEKAEAPGKKILISGGGRCNFTNLGAGPGNYLSANPHFAKSALARYTPADFIALVERYGIAWHEKTLGQLFCDGSAKQIVAMLLDECPPDKVTLTCEVDVASVTRGADGVFTVTAADGRTWRAPALVIATGGPSIPKMGASDFAYGLARQFGLKIVEPRPALVPLTLGGEDALFRELSGVAAPVRARAGSGKGKAEFAEAALFTHKGLSGPAILQISSYWRHGEEVGITFLPDAASDWLVEAKRDRPRTHLRTLLRERLPARLADALADRLALERELGNRVGQRPARRSGKAGRLALCPQRYRGSRQGRSYRWRYRYGGTLQPDNGSRQGSRSLRHWRGCGRHRMARRLQLPMGVGERLCLRRSARRGPRAPALIVPGRAFSYSRRA